MANILNDIIATKKKELEDTPSISALELVLKNQDITENSFSSRFLDVFKNTYGPVLIAELKKLVQAKA